MLQTPKPALSSQLHGSFNNIEYSFESEQNSSIFSLPAPASSGLSKPIPVSNSTKRTCFVCRNPRTDSALLWSASCWRLLYSCSWFSASESLGLGEEPPVSQFFSFELEMALILRGGNSRSDPICQKCQDCQEMNAKGGGWRVAELRESGGVRGIADGRRRKIFRTATETGSFFRLGRFLLSQISCFGLGSEWGIERNSKEFLLNLSSLRVLDFHCTAVQSLPTLWNWNNLNFSCWIPVTLQIHRKR